MHTTIHVPGPMHPDLFGGETPIMVPVVLESPIFLVHATQRRERTYFVCADDAAAAREIALERFEDDGLCADDDTHASCSPALSTEDTRAVLINYFRWRDDYTPPTAGTVLDD